MQYYICFDPYRHINDNLLGHMKSVNIWFFYFFSIKHLARDEFLMQVRTKLAIHCYAKNSVLVHTQEVKIQA